MIDSVNIVRDANISPCGKHRYGLTRAWDKQGLALGVIMLNPSTADAKTDDSTIRKLMKIADNNGFGMINVVNLFDLITPDPEILKKELSTGYIPSDTPIDSVLMMLHHILLAWGNFAIAELRADEIIKKKLMIYSGKLYVLNLNKNGSPAHPLYQKDNSILKPVKIKSGKIEL